MAAACDGARQVDHLPAGSRRLPRPHEPGWSARELTGKIERIKPETRDTSTIVIRPSFPWPGHRPGQYLRIGVELDGIRHWRAYSLTSDPGHPDGLVSITVKHVSEGRMSPYFTQHVEPGSMVCLGDVEGEFRMPDPLPERTLMISAGSGITPIWCMLRELERRDKLDDVVHVHCAREPDQVIFGEDLRRMNTSRSRRRSRRSARSTSCPTTRALSCSSG